MAVNDNTENKSNTNESTYSTAWSNSQPKDSPTFIEPIAT